MYDLLVTNAKTRASPDRLVDIAIAGGRVVDIAPSLPRGPVVARRVAGSSLRRDASSVIDAAGRLVTEAFVNGHLHLDKVYTLERAGGEALAAYQGGTMGAAMTAIELAARVKEQYNENWITPNVERALRLAVKFGCSFIRAFADVDTKAKLVGVKALLAARKRFADRVTLQVVAFPQNGIVRDPGAEDYVREALELGADVIGGIPWIEYTDDDAREHIDRMFALAVRYDKDISMLGSPARQGSHRGGERSAHRAAPRPGSGSCSGWSAGCARAGRHRRRLLSLRPEQHARGGLSRRSSPVDDDERRDGAPLRLHKHAGRRSARPPQANARDRKRRGPGRARRRKRLRSPYLA